MFTMIFRENTDAIPSFSVSVVVGEKPIIRLIVFYFIFIDLFF